MFTDGEVLPRVATMWLIKSARGPCRDSHLMLVVGRLRGRLPDKSTEGGPWQLRPHTDDATDSSI